MRTDSLASSSDGAVPASGQPDVARHPAAGAPGSAVVTRLSGGLGNQMFQYAAGRSLAQRAGARLILDATPFTLRHERRSYALQDYDIVADVSFVGHAHAPLGPEVDMPLRPRGLSRMIGGIIHPLRQRAAHGSAKTQRFSVFAEKGFDYHPTFARLGAQTYLDGYWQSPRYFGGVVDLVRKELQLPRAPDAANARWLARIREANAVCVHVRRGDYLLTPHLEHHGVCSTEYYMRAMRRMRERTVNPEFFVFSDDWEWAREHLSAGDVVVADANGPQAGQDELRLMAACRHHILANSSLSWWAAWLAAGEDQIVIAPIPWFNAKVDTPDLLPPSWLVLPKA